VKVLVCEQPFEFNMQEREQPVPAPGQALVRIRRIGVCGTDLHAYRGRQPFFTYPRILGHELSGEIIQIPDNAQGLKAGDRVAVLPYVSCGKCAACLGNKPNCCVRLQVLGVHTDGGMQECITIAPELLIPVQNLTLEQAAIVECLSIGAHAVRRAQIRPGERVLVVGSGPIGLGVMKFVKLAGAEVTAMDIQEDRLRFCREWVSTSSEINAAEDPVGQIEELTNGDYFPVVFDATGNASSMERSFAYAAHGGRIVFVGLVQSDISFHDPDFHRKELTLLSSRNATREDFQTVIRAIEGGHVDTDKFITHRASLDRAIDEWEKWLKPETGVIKAMIEL